MLSVSYSVADVKATLRRTYSDYGFATEEIYTAAVEEALRDVEFLWMYPVLGTTYYATIKALDRTGLSTLETYLYWSEIYFSCSGFLKKQDAVISDEGAGAVSENLEVEGYRYESSTGTSGNSSSNSTNSRAVKDYYEKAVGYMCNAGWNPHQLQKAGGALEGYFVEPTYGTYYGDE